MAVYDYRCTNQDCELYNKEVEYYVDSISQKVVCPTCSNVLQRLFPLIVHIKGGGKEVDGKDLGLVTKEKNEALKKKHSGYSYEEQNLRKKITDMTNKIKK